ncbi:MAG: hypothetical protein ACI9AR_000468 [Flavobacteriaceae bacterium]|jgi:hypothetical protein
MLSFLKKIGLRITSWYKKYREIGIVITTFLFALQLVHLLWLFFDVILVKLGGESLFQVSGVLKQVIILIDYTEIPALVMGSVLYIMEMRLHGFGWRPFLMLLFLNTQWLHLYWITDEFILTSFGGQGGHLPSWLAWVAIGIDYLELPVMYDMVKRSFRVLKKRYFTPSNDVQS